MSTQTTTWVNANDLEKKYVITWTDNISITPNNLTTLWPIPTVKRALNIHYSTTVSWPAVTRYIHMIFQSLPQEDMSGTDVVFKVTFAKDSKVATVTRYTVLPYGQLKGTNAALRDALPSRNFVHIFNASTTSMDSGSYGMTDIPKDATVTFSGFTPTVNLGYNLTSTLPSQFGYIKNYCSATLTCTSQIGWTCNNITVPSSTTAHSIVSMGISGGKGGQPSGTYQNALSLNANYNLGVLTQAKTTGYARIFYTNSNVLNVGDSSTGPGYRQTHYIDINIQDYSPSIILNAEIERNDNDTTQATLTVQYSLNILNKTAINQEGNTNAITNGTVTVYYELTPSDGSAKISRNTVIIPDNTTITNLNDTASFVIPNLNPELSYSVSCWIKDRIATSPVKFNTTLSTEYRTIDFKAGGTGIGFGGAAYVGQLDDYFPTFFHDDVMLSLSPSILQRLVPVIYTHGSWDVSVENGHIIYSSSSSFNVNSGWDTAKIIFTGYSSFTVHVRSYAESNYDYILVSTLDNDTLANCTTTQSMRNLYSNSTYTKATTRGSQSATTYTTVTFDNIDPATIHYFYIIYQKDSSTNSNSDKGYFYIDY